MLLFNILMVVIVSYFFLITVAKMKNSTRRIALLFGGLILLLVVIFRPLEVPDTLSYKTIFERIRTNYNYGFAIFGSKEYTTGVEYGFLTLSQMIKKLVQSNYRLYFAIIAIIEILLYIRFINKWCEKNLRAKANMVYFILPYLGFMYLCVTIRAGLAMTLALNAFLYGAKKDIWKKILIYLVAMTFHRSVLVMLVVEIVYYFMPVLSKRIHLTIWGINAILALINPTRLYVAALGLFETVLSKISFLRYEHYFSNAVVAGRGISLRSIFFLMIGLILLFYDEESVSVQYKKLLNIYVVGLCAMNACSFIAGGFRIYDYFMLSLPLLMTERYSITGIKNNPYIMWGTKLLYGIAGTIIIMRLA